jgi:nucleotide-binding universal stress UspA family protein
MHHLASSRTAMKTILVPTDFSVAAQMACQYGAALARATRAQLVLLHTYHVPVSYPGASGKAVRGQRLEKQQGKKLEVFRRELAESYGIEARSLVMPGLVAEQVPSLAQTLAADLVVMGTRRNGDPTRDLFGSVTTAVSSRKRSCWLLIFKPYPAPTGSAYWAYWPGSSGRPSGWCTCAAPKPLR